jgi:hypothetical protein
MKRLALLLLLFTSTAFAQTPTYIKQLLPTATSVNVAWDYSTTDEAQIDSFVIQRTAFGATTTITSPYDQQTVVNQKTIRTLTYPLPTGLLAGQKAFFRIVARKTGLADSAPSPNILEVDIVATPPSPQNFRFP